MEINEIKNLYREIKKPRASFLKRSIKVTSLLKGLKYSYKKMKEITKNLITSQKIKKYNSLSTNLTAQLKWINSLQRSKKKQIL